MNAIDYFERLRASGYRLTVPRRAVVTALLEVGNGHISADELWRRAAAVYPALGRATVYRTLEVCTNLGLLRPLLLGNSGLQYILPAEGHHHLLCTHCGDSVEFDECGLGILAEDLGQRFDFAVQGHLVELYGACASCRAPAQTARPVA
jgi:Fe2+ or Zn2+ uptake regulation protein